MTSVLPDPDDHPQTNRIVLVTGPSGAGRSTAINVLEDLGYEAIDNMPMRLLPRLLDGPPIDRPMALGLDVRNRDFSVDAILDLARRGHAAAPTVQLLFLDCSTDVLLRRYSETRRRHPLAPAEDPGLGIAREADLLAPIRAIADILIDTSELTVHDLRDELQTWFDGTPEARLAVSVQSFSYKRGVPRGVDTVFDCRFLRNPHWEPALRGMTGLDPEVLAYVEADPIFDEYFAKVTDLITLLLPAYRDEGKAHLTIGIGCTGGQHRSVALTEKLANALAKQGWQVSKRHRELERRAPTSTAGAHGVSVP
ncbi:RNase adapter RapZ [Psychromarinibacter sp. C21-152]|uniref:RNase adapter RapZ n=1 Tax=Psychromarinibacter sediminicola TaxID=3033385 RepID=A0AAE3NNX5_9RHOB|nr:RNase adapter RapZ [Psychromarinibacter sediminicola]MDF0600808.1 RNase adapter RapZ [Psychromarinibacter sediminicola]